MRIQTANRVIELDTEVTHRIDKLKETTSAILGQGAPDFLSIGYRCQKLGFGFLWELHSIPYFIFPDQRTEVDLAVENYVPYLYKTGCISSHFSCVNVDICGFGLTCGHIDDVEEEWRKMFDVSNGLLGDAVFETQKNGAILRE